MPTWLVFVLEELGKLLPDIINWIDGSGDPLKTAQDFVSHIKAFKKP